MATVVLLYLLASVFCGYALFNTSPKTGTGARVARPISLVGVRSRYPVAGRPTDILLGLLGDR